MDQFPCVEIENLHRQSFASRADIGKNGLPHRVLGKLNGHIGDGTGVGVVCCCGSTVITGTMHSCDDKSPSGQTNRGAKVKGNISRHLSKLQKDHRR